MEQPEHNPEPADEDDILPPSSQWAGLGTRILSSAVLIALFLAALWIGGWLFIWLVLMAGLMMMREWNALTQDDGALARFAGLFYVTIPCASLIWLRQQRFDYSPDAGMYLVLYVMLAVWATDIGAYFTGRKIGGPKLAPVISPGKTWAGLGGGVAAAALTCGIIYPWVNFPPTLVLSIALGAMLAIISQAGDLFESWLKRRAGVKDSGTLIPGHGGLLDRIDGLTFAIPVFALAVYISSLP